MSLTAADAGPIYNLLEAALNETTRKEAEQALSAYESRVGFCSCLLEIISRKELDQKGGARWLAAVCFKNSVNRYWRARRETPGISDEEKPVLRARLLDLIADENAQVAVQLAVLVAKIARIDYPREWPELFPTLVQKLQSSDPLLTQRSYLLLNHVMKELSTKRLSVDQRTFAQVTSQLFEPTWSHWMRDTQALIQGLAAAATAGAAAAAAAVASPGAPPSAAAADGTSALLLLCDRWLLCVKTLRRMLVFGFPSDFKSVQEVPVLAQLVPAYLEAAQSLINYRTLSLHSPHLSPLSPFLSRAPVKLLKTIVAAHELHPFSFASQSLLLPTLHFCHTHITTNASAPSADTAAAATATPSPVRTRPSINSSSSSSPGQSPGGGLSGAGAVAGSPGGSATTSTAVAAADGSRGGGAEGSGGGEGEQPLFEPFVIECMLFVQCVLRCVAYKQDPSGQVVGAALPSLEAMRGKLAGAARGQLGVFFESSRVVHLAEVVVQRYLVLTAVDLSEWGSDPEVFYHEQGVDQWKERVRPCAEAMLLLLMEQHKEVLVPVLMNMLRQAIEACPAPSSPDADVAVTAGLLLKDACYDAVGVACYDLHDAVDFKAWFSSTLAPEMSCRHPNGRILRRRGAWLLGQWVSKVVGDLRTPAYQALVSLLGDGDMAVQLTACASLRALVDDVNFYEDEFAAFLEPSVRMLFQCLQQVQEFDSQLQIVNVVSLIIERMGEKIVPLADKILAHLPQVWEQSEGQSLLRIQVMQSLQRLIVSLGAQSPLCHPLLFPILRHSTDIQQPDELNLLEDGMQLWQVTLRHTPAMVPDLMALFPNLVPIMERSFEHLPVAIGIMESYILVGGPQFLQLHSSSLVRMVDAVMGNVKEKAMMLLMGLVDVIIQCYPSEAPPALEATLQKLLLILIGPTDYSDLVRGTAATVLARVMLQNSAYFAQMMTKDATRQLLQQQSAAKASAPPLFLFLDTWLDKFDSVSLQSKRKLSALALAVLLMMQEQQILERMDLILSACTSVLADDSPDSTPDLSTVGYDYVSTTSEAGQGGPTECESLRRRQVASIDPVHTVSFAPFLKEKLHACASVHGEAVFRAAMARVPPPIVSQLQQLG